MFLFFGGTAAVFVAMTAHMLFHLRWVRRLPALASGPNSTPSDAREGSAVRCSIVIPARNEEERIETTVRRALAQQHIAVEVIVVDDRSTDRTSAILDRLAADEARLRVTRIAALPDGWLGKCHACHVGARSATGDWILFTDADCWLESDVITRALQAAERDGADHITLTPGVTPEDLGAKGWHLGVLLSLADWISRVNRDRPKAHLGMGAFNLVRASGYKRTGGYEALRLTVLDDVRLGLLLRRAGLRTRAFVGGNDVECHWGTTVRSMIKVMEKNYFAALDYRLGVVLAGTVFMMLISTILILGLVSGTVMGLAATFSPLLFILPAGILTRRLGWSWPSAVCLPFMFPVFLYSLLNSVCVALSQGGIRWRDTFYSLEALRAGNVR